MAFSFSRKATQPQFEEMSKDMTDEQKRELEMALLKPEVLAKTTVPEPTYDSPLDRYVKVYFPNREDFDLFCKYIKVNDSRERTTREGKLIAESLDKMLGNK